MSESSQNNLPTLFEFSKIFGNLRKCSEMLGKLRKPSENFLYPSNLWHLWTEDQIQEFRFIICTGITLFALVLRFLHWCYSLTAQLSANQNRIISSYMLLTLERVETRSSRYRHFCPRQQIGNQCPLQTHRFAQLLIVLVFPAISRQRLNSVLPISQTP